MKLYIILALVLLSVCVFGFGCGGSSDDDSAPPSNSLDEENSSAVQAGEPIISAVAIGVSDLQAATTFYRDVIGMKVRRGYPNYLAEQGMEVVVLAAHQEGHRGALLVLMHDPAITDSDYYADNPAKLVFRVPDAQAFYDGILAAGGSEVGPGGTPPEPRYPQYPNLLIALAYSPNGYLIEMLEVPAEMAGGIECTDPYITGVGIGVSNLDASNDFYTNTLGMVFNQDIPVEGFMNEKELVAPTGEIPSLVLMNYVEPKDYLDNPVKLVFKVEDAAGFFDIIQKNAPEQIVISPETSQGDSVSGYVKDLDGTLIQVVQSEH